MTTPNAGANPGPDRPTSPDTTRQHTSGQRTTGQQLPVGEDVFAALVATLGADVAVTVTGRPQAQGDLSVWPWPADVLPAERAHAVAATSPVTGEVDVLDGRHVLAADGPVVAWGGQVSASGLTLGTLVVGADSVAVLGHPQHPDLRIGGPCVYVIRRSREAVPAPLALTAPAPQPEPEPDWVAVID